MIEKMLNRYNIRRSLKVGEVSDELENKKEEQNADGPVKVEKIESFRRLVNKNKNVDNDIKQKRKKILINAIKYLSLNNIPLKDYLSKKIFPSKPFELRGSEEFFDAVKFNNIELVKQGLRRSRDYLNQFDYFKQTPIHWAAKLGYHDLLKIFLKFSKMVNVYDREYRTPIFLAALNNHKKCVELLLENGGNAFIKDKNGNMAESVTTDDSIRLILQTSNDKQFAELNEINKKKIKNVDSQ